MNERIFSIECENKKIWGILHEPKRSLKEKTFIVFAHGMAGYRIGPHQMFVTYARQLAKEGFFCFRFDFSGNGFSEESSEKSNENFKIKQFHKVVSTLKHNFNPEKIVLLGICSGAHLAFHLALKINVDYLILLSIMPLERERKELAYRSSIYNMRNLVMKLFIYETWIKIYKRDLNLHVILPRYIKNVKIFLSIFKINTSKKPVNKEKFKSNIKYTTNALGIFGENDPETKSSSAQVSKILKINNIPFETHIIKGANHSFYSLKWEAEIYSLILRWLRERIGSN